MHENNIEMLLKEVQRLVNYEAEILSNIKTTPGLIGDKKSTGTLNPTNIDHYLESLHTEAEKLARKEMVVAVVGNMKAGKSTTINAIVGTELLPNRSAAATSLPTLIRHVAGQTPVLHFSKNTPLNELLLDFRRGKSPEQQQQLEQLKGETNTRDLAEFIDSDKLFEELYHGEAAIHEFLKLLNELPRQARALGFEFPFEQYANMHDLPVIEVEFEHLRGQQGGLGSLALLDTPGPNEAGQTHLRPILEKQLREASAVIGVLNFTQLDADHAYDFHQQLKSVIDTTGDRLYLLLNRFDEHTRNDPPKDEIIAHIAQKIFAGDITENRIFPTAAISAYLSQRASSYLSRGQELPNPEAPGHGWVEEFLEKGFGTFWEDYINDIDMLASRASKVWDKSGFNEPLQRVIKTAHNQAIYELTRAAADRVGSYAEVISTFVDARSEGLKRQAEDLKQHIDQLEQDIAAFKTLETTAERHLNQALQDFDKEMNQQLAQAQKNVAGAIELYTSDTKAEHNKLLAIAKQALDNDQPIPEVVTVALGDEIEKLFDKERKKGWETLFDKMLGKQANHEFTDAGLIEYSTHDKAQAYARSLEQLTEEKFIETREQMSAATRQLVSELEQTIQCQVVADSQQLLDSINNRLQNDGFTLHFNVPLHVGLGDTRIDVGKLEQGIDEKHETKRELRRQDSLWGGIKRGIDFFDAEWGYDDVLVKKTTYIINRDNIRRVAVEAVTRQVEQWREQASESITEPLNDAVQQFFEELALKIEGVRADLQQGIDDGKKSQQQQRELLEALAQLRAPSAHLKEDADFVAAQVNATAGGAHE